MANALAICRNPWSTSQRCAAAWALSMPFCPSTPQQRAKLCCKGFLPVLLCAELLLLPLVLQASNHAVHLLLPACSAT